MILAGVEVHRFGLQEELVQLVDRMRMPVAATLLGKSVISEAHPLYLGVYEGAMGHAAVQQYVESADCVLMLGCFMTDINLGIYTANLEPSRTIYATSERISIHRHQFENIPFPQFVQALRGLRGGGDGPRRRSRRRSRRGATRRPATRGSPSGPCSRPSTISSPTTWS